MNRTRYFFKALLLLVAIGCSAPKSETQDIKPVKKDVSLQLYSLRDDISKDYEGVLKKIGEMGYTSVEAANYNDGKFYGKTPEEFKADLEKNGLYALSSHTTRQLSEDELKSKNYTESLKWWDGCIAAHKAAGMKYIVAPWMDIPENLNDLQAYCEYYNEIGKRCKANGLAFGYHNHAHEFNKVGDKVMLDYMIENTDPELVFYELDVYWAVRGQVSPVSYFKKYPGRFQLLHIKDDKELGESGMVGFDAIFKNTDVAGTKHLIVEIEHYDFEPVESVKRCLDYLIKHPTVKEKYN